MYSCVKTPITRYLTFIHLSIIYHFDKSLFKKYFCIFTFHIYIFIFVLRINAIPHYCAHFKYIFFCAVQLKKRCNDVQIYVLRAHTYYTHMYTIRDLSRFEKITRCTCSTTVRTNVLI